MAQDRAEAFKRGLPSRKAAATKHPYAAIEHRVIDSDAYADLSFSSRSLLTMLARQTTMPNNNGRLQAAHSYLERYGFSDNTVTRGVAELIEHGFVFRTRSGGFHQGIAQYALTWLPLTEKRDGLSCNGFELFAWRNWSPSKKKTRPPNVRAHSRRNGELTMGIAANLAANPPPKNADIELMPVIEALKPVNKNRQSKHLWSPWLIRHSLTADRGMLR